MTGLPDRVGDPETPPAGTSPRPKPQGLLFPITITSLNVTSPIPDGNRPVFRPAFRFFGNYDLWNPGGEGKEVQPGLLRVPVQTEERRGDQEGADPPSVAAIPAPYATVCPDTIRFPSRSISTSEFGVTRKNRHVPCFDRSQSSAVMAASLAMSRSWAISSLNSSASCWMVARIAGANMTRTNATGTFDMIAMSKIRSGPLIVIWTMPRAFAIGTASSSARCGRGPRLMGGASL